MLDFICMGSADLFGTGREQRFKMKIYVSSGIRTHATPIHDRKISALDRSATLVRYKRSIYRLAVFWFMSTNGYVTITVCNRYRFDTQCKIILAKLYIEIKNVSLVWHSVKIHRYKMIIYVSGAAMVWWLSSWRVEQEVRGLIPCLAASISEIGYLLLPSRDMAEIPLKRRIFSIQPTNQPIIYVLDLWVHVSIIITL